MQRHHRVGYLQKPEGPLLPGIRFCDSGSSVYSSCRGSMPHASSRKMSHFLPDGVVSLQLGKAGSRAAQQLTFARLALCNAPVRIAGAKRILHGVQAQCGPGQDSQLASVLTLRSGWNRLTGSIGAVYLEHCQFAFCSSLSFSHSTPNTPTSPTRRTFFLDSLASTVLALMPRTVSLAKWHCPYLKACPFFFLWVKHTRVFLEEGRDQA